MRAISLSHKKSSHPYLGECGGSGRHEDLPDSVVEALHALQVDVQEALRRALLGHLVLQVPHTVLVCVLPVSRADLDK